MLKDDAELVINYSSTRWVLDKVSKEAYQNENCEGKGMPYIYTFRGGNYLVYYYPDQAYSLEVTYLKEYSDLSADGDTNDFTNSASRLIEYEALSRLSAELRQDEKMEAYYSARAEKEKDVLITRTNEIMGTGQLTIEE